MTAPPTPTFTVTCNANGGTGGTSFTVNQGTLVNPNTWCNTVSRSGHTFAGWSPGTTTVNSNTTFVAQWTVIHSCSFQSGPHQTGFWMFNIYSCTTETAAQNHRPSGLETLCGASGTLVTCEWRAPGAPPL